MARITDVSPTSPASQNHSVTGRMLSIACSPEGSMVFAGSYSNLWLSTDGGQTFAQVTLPQPSSDQFIPPGGLCGWCALDIAAGLDGDQLIVVALMCFDLATLTNDGIVSDSRGVWRSADNCLTWTQVHQFSPEVNLGQLEWAPDNSRFVCAAGGTSLAISPDGGVDWQDTFPFGTDTSKRVNHVAISAAPAGSNRPEVIYALGSGCMSVSFDAGLTWIEDQAALPTNIGGQTEPIANGNSAKVMAISPLSPRQVYIAADGSGNGQAATLYLLDYTAFSSASPISTHQALGLPGYLTEISSQDSGNVFLAATKPSMGNLLFLGAQRPVCYVGALNASGTVATWHALDSNVHWDLHGMLLSPDFTATMSEGNYAAKSGTVWLLSDGGIYRSTNGGNTFVPIPGLRTLAAFNIAGVAIPGSGPALSLNTGDNDGFYSLDGGTTWQFQDYGGGDNDCSFADPLRPYSMFVCTPRWDGSGNIAPASKGQTVSIYEAAPGNLPNASTQGTSTRHVIVGPLPIPDPQPGDPTHTVPGWNADSSFFTRGSRPIVLGLVGEEVPAQGDYIFVLNPVLEPVLVRSLSILNISSRNEWNTTATEPIPGANVYRLGPPLPAPSSAHNIPSTSLGIVQASGGHNSTVYYVGGDGTLQSWQEGEVAWTPLVPATNPPIYTDGVTQATRFFVSPYLPSLVYVLDVDSVKRSEDGGKTWSADVALATQLTWNQQIPFSSDDDSSNLGGGCDLLLTDMKFDPNNPLLRFAVGQGGAFYTADGTTWTRLLHTGAFPSRPALCYYDPITDPSDPALYVALSERGVVKIDGFAVAPQVPTVVPASLTFEETQVGTTSLQQTATVFAGSATITGISVVEETQGASADFPSVPPAGEHFSVVNGQLVMTVWFRPTAGGPRNAALEIAHNAASSPLIVELSGTGNPAPTPLLEVSPTSLFFTPKKVTNHTVTLTNTGTAPLFIQSVTFDEPNFFFTTSCPVGANTLAPGQTCTITVGYHFIGPGGSANLIIVHNAPGSPYYVGLDTTSITGNPP